MLRSESCHLCRLRNECLRAESPTEPGAEVGQQLGEMVQRTARVLDALFGNNDTSRLFVHRGGVNSLLQLYDLPKLAPSFGSHSPLHAVTAALRMLAQGHAKHISKYIAVHLRRRLASMRRLAEVSLKLRCFQHT